MGRQKIGVEGFFGPNKVGVFPSVGKIVVVNLASLPAKHAVKIGTYSMALIRLVGMTMYAFFENLLSV